MSRISLALDPITETISVVSEVPPLNLDAKTKMVAVSTFRETGEQVGKPVKFRVPQLRANSLSLMKSIVTKHGLLIVDEGWIGLVSEGKLKTLSKARLFAPDALRCG